METGNKTYGIKHGLLIMLYTFLVIFVIFDIWFWVTISTKKVESQKEEAKTIEFIAEFEEFQGVHKKWDILFETGQYDQLVEDVSASYDTDQFDYSIYRTWDHYHFYEAYSSYISAIKHLDDYAETTDRDAYDATSLLYYCGNFYNEYTRYNKTVEDYMYILEPLTADVLTRMSEVTGLSQEELLSIMDDIYENTYTSYDRCKDNAALILGGNS